MTDQYINILLVCAGNIFYAVVTNLVTYIDESVNIISVQPTKICRHIG